MMNKTQKKTLIILTSPIVIMIIGNLSARFFLNMLGNWAWAGYFPVYWIMLILFMFFAGNQENQRLLFKKSAGSNWWILLAIGLGFISFPVLFFPNMNVMHSFYLVSAWFSFALVNSLLEEAYWRGFLLDETGHFPRVFGVIYSSVLFTLIHPLNLGVFSKIQAFDPDKPMMLVPFLSILIVLSLSWSLLYLKTKSLRLSVLSHFLTDLGNLSIFLFMNMVQF